MPPVSVPEDMTGLGLSPAECAEAAAEAIRALNHATLGLARAGYEYPADVDRVIASLHTMTMRLPQAIGQAARWLERELIAGRVGHDQVAGAGGVAVQVEDLLGDLERAAREANELAATFDSAREVSAHLNLPDPGDSPAGSSADASRRHP